MAIELTNSQIDKYIIILASKIDKTKYSNLYPIAMGGYPVAIKLQQILNLPISFELKENSLIIDDLIDSGKTVANFKNDKAVLFSKIKRDDIISCEFNFNDWIILPWEQKKTIEDNLIRILEYIGENPNREGLVETPQRIIKSWDKLFAGYKENLDEKIKVFEDDKCDEMIILKDIEFYSTCEHHFLPFYGKGHIAYIPNKKIIGISKLARILEHFSRKLQIQERLANEVCNYIFNKIEPKGCIVVLEAQHFCMIARGVQKQNSKMITSSLKGVFEKIETRDEFFNLIK